MPKEPKMNATDYTTRALIRRMAMRYLKPHVSGVLKAFSFMIVAAAMTAMIAQLMQPILDDVLGDKNPDMILPVASTVLFVFVMRGVATYFHSTMMIQVGQSIVAQIQKDVFDKLMIMDLAYFHDNPSGQLLSRIVNDVNVMRIAVSDSLTGLGRSLFTLLFLIAVMFYQDWQLSIAAFVIFPFAAGFVGYLGKRLRKVSGSIQDELAHLSDLLSQTFRGIRQVKAYGMEAYEEQRASQAIEKVKDLNIKSVRIGNLSTPVNEVLVGAVLFGVITYGGYQALEGDMTSGQLAAFLAAFIMAYEPMKKIARLNNTLQMGLGASERIFDILDQPIGIQDCEGVKNLKIANLPKVCFDSVGFGYKNDVKALDGVSFTLKPGCVTAFVGHSGAGKSTILNLIPRFYDVDAGKITIDGQDIREISLSSLRQNIALVSQDITIFDDTVLANIRYGSPDASDKDVMEAAKQAFAHSFIQDLEQGYGTVLGEDGVSLSGGQRQRISIARAILRNAPILLLDEATSALDNESEQAVQKALKALEKGRTTLVIAHRLSTIQGADTIIVMDKGCVVEQGKHADLLKQQGLYAKMYEAGL